MNLDMDRIRQRYQNLPEPKQDYPKLDYHYTIKQTGDRRISFLGSTPDVDRMQEKIEADAWDIINYKRNPVFLWAHSYRELPIGKALRVETTRRGLEFDIKFADHEFAQTVYDLYRNGFLKSCSVGFIPLAWRPGDDKSDGPGVKKVYTRVELLELSACPVGANPHAVSLAYQKGYIPTREHYAKIKDAARDMQKQNVQKQKYDKALQRKKALLNFEIFSWRIGGPEKALEYIARMRNEQGCRP